MNGPERHHELKSWPEAFEGVWRREKTHEVRRDDRGFAVGDTIRLREYLPDRQAYSGRWIGGVITYVTGPGSVGSNARLPEGIAVWSFREHARGGED